MRRVRKLVALLLSLAMVLAMSGMAMASVGTLGDGSGTDGVGEQGVFSTKDTPAPQNKTLVLEKELKVYNKDESTIKAPTISYKYTIGAATVTTGTTVTDSDKSGTVHDTGVNVTATVKAGEGTPVIANNGIVSWTASEDVTAADAGYKNIKGISIDFSSVVFTGAGVYRYVITEGLDTGFAYASSGVTETVVTGSDPAVHNHTRYIDVYVRAANPTPDGKTAADPEYWDIYGFTCFMNNTSITEDNKATGPVKTTGFVAGTTNGSTETTADSYYTFNVTIKKTVVNDAYGAANIAFPFSVLFTNNSVSAGTIVTNGSTAPTGTDFTHNTAVALTSGNLKGIATLKSGQQIKYVGIPNGTAVEVYETNIATGVTYKVDTVKDSGTAVTDNSVTSGTTPAEAIHQTSRADYESTAAILTTTADVDDDTAHSIEITNTFLNISPTGLMFRYGPYVLILLCGALLLFLGVKFMRRNKEED